MVPRDRGAPLAGLAAALALLFSACRFLLRFSAPRVCLVAITAFSGLIFD
jgi:hypothetical protein